MTTEARPPVVLPPSMVPGLAREPLRETLGRARWALGSYWLLVASGYVVLLVTALLWWHGDRALTVAMLASSAAGVAAGNLLGLLRVRPWVVQSVVHAALFAACFSAAGGVPPLLVVTVFAFLWSVACGHFTLQRRFSLAALWIPMICWTAAIVTILEKSGRLHTWQAGHKEGVWQPATLALLFLVIVEFFLFLAGQEHYHAQVWQAGAVAAPVTLTRHRELGATRLTGRGLAAILVFALASCAFVAKIAPYLWRTGPQEGRQGDGDADADRDRDRRQSGRPNRAPSPDWDGLQRSVERAFREAERQTREVLPFVPLFLLNRPLRRLWLLRQLRRPVPPVPPSERAARLWRYVVIALGDAGLAPRPGEAYEQTVARAVEVRTARGEPLPEGLAETSELYQRVRFGLGIPAGSLDALQASAERAFVAVRAPLTPWQRVKSWWRKLEA